ncbi:hypothetical protein JX265_011979 [Neoarthrinium moseri]|uniref:Heterokaryon incompatibility domain-containing protein n=1 Tax=Neoarthrinium moseri TaxID=1658444 RepID=A0A9P9WAY0_9PEZI|nr:hypothetical protein JX265_011979 [Neoarthrinium moseri]
MSTQAETAQHFDDGKLKLAANFTSQMAAITVSTITCDLHEHCDGSCSGGEPILFQPLQIGAFPYRSTVRDRPVSNLPLVQPESPPLPSEEFQYTPIDSASGQIRLIHLHNGVFRSDTIVLDLVTVNVFDPACPNFGALSYNWGEPKFDQGIVCDGKRLNINASLHECLKRHRQDWLEKPEFLWVDAICINQQDTTELNQQVLLMGDIYRGAAIVLVDFGDVAKEWYVAYDLMLRIRVIRQMLDERVEDLVSDLLFERVGLPTFSHVAWHNFGVLFTSPWLERTWTIQEVVLAKDVRCRYGRFNFEWDVLVSASHLMGLQRTSAISSLTTKQMIGLLNLDRIVRIRLEFRARRLRPMQLLWRTRDCMVSNPRDKIIGLLGMLLPSGTKTKFEPDYGWPLEKLFYEFARYVLREYPFSERAALLSFAGLQRRRVGKVDQPQADIPLPSWVPDWLANDSASAAVYSIIREAPFRAAKGTTPIMYVMGEYGTDECYITQMGFRLGRISHLGLSADELNKEDEQETTTDAAQITNETKGKISSIGDANIAAMRTLDIKWLQWHNEAARAVEAATAEGKLHRYEDTQSAFAITLLAGDQYTDNNATATTVPIENPVKSLAAVVADISSTEPTLGQIARNAESLYKTQTQVACRDRKIAVTDEGYMGLVPMCSQVGDEVFLLGGASVPFVLRRRDPAWNKFILVGDCYIHGVMEGEVMEGNSLDNWTPVLIY